MINYKNEILKDEKPNCEYRTIALDLADRKARLELFQQLNSECKKALIVTEGLIIYLTVEQAADWQQIFLHNLIFVAGSLILLHLLFWK
jgi:O-methyltransferase involved in polyketide biosynthesis